MNKKILLTIMIGMFLISFASAYDSHKQNTDYELVASSNNATTCDVTYIKFPNGSKNILNQEMTKDGTTFYSTINSGNFSSLGTTCLGISCTDGSTSEVGSKCLDVSYNGKEKADGSVIVFYTLIFILIFGFGIIYFLKALAHTINLEMDLIDAAIMMSTYFGMWIFYYFSGEYLGNFFISEILETAISIGWITHIFLPLVGFLVSFIMTNLKFKKKARVTY
jgi:hypothetical protein